MLFRWIDSLARWWLAWREPVYVKYTGYSVLNVDPSDILNAHEFSWSATAEHVVETGRKLTKEG